MESGPSEDELRSALIIQSANIFDIYDVKAFLLQKNFYKKLGTRFICWMIKFAILPSNRTEWVSTIHVKYNTYYRLCRNKLIHEIPLLNLNENLSYTINADLSRTKKWFFRFLKQIHMREDLMQHSEDIASRVLTLISLTDESLTYTQGHDRYVWIAILVTLGFSVEGLLTLEFAEAMTYYLTIELIKSNPVYRLVDKLPHLEEYFDSLDQMVQIHSPQAYATLNLSGYKSLHYALKWELTLFSDDHGVYELLLIWDYIIANIVDIKDVLHCMCVAHLKQVQLNVNNCNELVFTVQNNTSWDVPRLLDDVDRLISNENNSSIFKDFLTTNFCNIFCFK